MKTIDILKNPYNDNQLNFNEDTGRYELTLEETKTLCDVMPIKNDSILTRRIKMNSLIVYNYIADHSAKPNKDAINFFLHRTENGRKFLLDLLSVQMESDLKYASNSLGQMPTVNTQSGQVMDRYAVRENILCLAAESIFDNSADYFGFSLGYSKQFPSGIFQIAYLGTKEN